MSLSTANVRETLLLNIHTATGNYEFVIVIPTEKISKKLGIDEVTLRVLLKAVLERSNFPIRLRSQIEILERNTPASTTADLETSLSNAPSVSSRLSSRHESLQLAEEMDREGVVLLDAYDHASPAGHRTTRSRMSSVRPGIEAQLDEVTIKLEGTPNAELDDLEQHHATAAEHEVAGELAATNRESLPDAVSTDPQYDNEQDPDDSEWDQFSGMSDLTGAASWQEQESLTRDEIEPRRIRPDKPAQSTSARRHGHASRSDEQRQDGQHDRLRVTLEVENAASPAPASRKRKHDRQCSETEAMEQRERSASSSASPTPKTKVRYFERPKKKFQYRRPNPAPESYYAARTPKTQALWDDFVLNHVYKARHLTHVGRIEETDASVPRAGGMCKRCVWRKETSCRTYRDLTTLALFSQSAPKVMRCGQCLLDGQKCIDA